MRPRDQAFTLIEVLVSLAILAIVVLLFAQVIEQTSITTSGEEKHLDIASMSRVSLDRLDTDLSGLITGGTSTLIVIKNLASAGAGRFNDALIFVTSGRTQLRSGISENAIRLGIRAYRIEAFTDSALDEQKAPMLAWGDGTITWTTPGSSSSQASSNIGKALARAVSDVTQNTSAGGSMLQFHPLADGILRFEVCFILSNGTFTKTPPISSTFASLGSGNVYPVALSAEDSSDPGHLYVKALLIGIVGIDSSTRRLAGTGSGRLADLSDVFSDPPADQTPLQAWNFQTNPALASKLSPPAFPAPVARSIRIYQRYYYVN